MGVELRRLLLAALLTLAPAAWATDYYVRTDGNDANTGTANTAGGAWATINKCGSTLVAGDRCLIQSGTYRGQRGATITNNGALESNNLLPNCTCTNGTNTINCGSAIPGTVAAGDYVQCDSGNGFSWSRVQSVASSTITLAEPYRGATSTTAGADTLDVANFIVISGQGAAASDTVFTDWFDMPVGLTWTQDPTYPDVWSYDPATISGTTTADKAWKGKFCSNNYLNACLSDTDCGGGTCQLAVKGIRSVSALWDTYYLPHLNGREGYIRLGSSTNDVSYGASTAQGYVCPAGDNTTHIFNVSTVPGSYTYDTSLTGKVYVHATKTCVGGTKVGYGCLADADCPSSTCGASPNPGTLTMQAAYAAPMGNANQPTGNIVLDARGNYVIVENLTIEGGFHDQGGSGTPISESLTLGGENSRYSNINVWQGQIHWNMSKEGGGAINDALFENIDALSGNRCTDLGDVAMSGVKWYNVEMRGTKNQLWNCGGGFRGASKTDRVIIDRLFAHRNQPNMTADGDNNGTTCNGNSVTWDKVNEVHTGSNAWIPGHGVFFGNAGANVVLCNLLIRNSLFETTGQNADNDSLGLNGVVSSVDPTCTDNQVVYNTFLDQNVANRTLGVQGGRNSGGNTSANLVTYGNAFITEWTGAGTGAITRFSGYPAASAVSDYNAFVYPQWDFNGGGTSQNTSQRIWNSGETLSSVITNNAQEAHSVQICRDGCSAATPGSHFNSTSTQVVDAVVDDGDVSDPTPSAGSKLIGAGPPNGVYPCPSVDFYGNPRNDGACDIGAVELQGQTPVPTVTTTTGNWTDGASVTIIGTNFGTKSPAAPLVWDDATGANILSKWRQVLPNNISEDPTQNTNYRTAPFNGINGPHARAPKFIGGLHKRDGFYTGNNVVLEKQFTKTNNLYVSFWTMRDPTWKWCSDPGVTGCGTSDDNWKDAWYDQTAETYSGNGWNIEADPKAHSCNDAGNWQWHIYDSTGNCNAECNTATGSHITYGLSKGPPCSWRLVEYNLKTVPTATADAIQIFENGSRRMNVTGYTDGTYTGTTRYFSVGGYSRAMSDTNWRYFADVYMDTTPARVVLCQNPTISPTDHGVCYPQIPTAWSDTSITVTVNQAEFQGGTTAYLYVYNGSDLVSTTGTPIVLSATDTSTNTKIKGNVRIVGSGTKVK